MQQVMVSCLILESVLCLRIFWVLSTSHSHAKKEPCGKPKSSSAVKPEEPSSLIGSAGLDITYELQLMVL